MPGGEICDNDDPETGIVFFLSVSVQKNTEHNAHLTDGHDSCSCEDSVIPAVKHLKGEIMNEENLNVLLNMEPGASTSWKISEAKPVKKLKYPLCFSP